MLLNFIQALLGSNLGRDGGGAVFLVRRIIDQGCVETELWNTSSWSPLGNDSLGGLLRYDPPGLAAKFP
jgi:hypothetical protein